MNVFVTGATGFIGSHLVRRLAADGHRVRCLVRPGRDAGALEAAGAEVVRGEVTDPGEVQGAPTGCEAACHLAALLGGWGVKEADLRRVNVEGTRCLLEACRAAHVRRFLHVSTPGVVGIGGQALATEDEPARPTGAYERTKWQAEQAALAAGFAGSSSSAHATDEMEVVVVRPDFVYGPGDLRRLELFERIRRGRFRLLGKSSARVRPTYVSDVIEGMVLALTVPAAAGEVLNIAGPRLVTFREFAGTIARLVGGPPPRAGVPVWLARVAAILSVPIGALLRRPPLVTRSRVRFLTVDHGTSIEKARRLLGYEPKVELAEGLARTVAWYRDHGLLPP